jgi:hypothetical protein
MRASRRHVSIPIPSIPQFANLKPLSHSRGARDHAGMKPTAMDRYAEVCAAGEASVDRTDGASWASPVGEVVDVQEPPDPPGASRNRTRFSESLRPIVQWTGRHAHRSTYTPKPWPGTHLCQKGGRGPRRRPIMSSQPTVRWPMSTCNSSETDSLTPLGPREPKNSPSRVGGGDREASRLLVRGDDNGGHAGRTRAGSWRDGGGGHLFHTSYAHAAASAQTEAVVGA